MEPERPPEIDADYRLVHGPWPRWVLQLGLVKLALQGDRRGARASWRSSSWCVVRVWR